MSKFDALMSKSGMLRSAPWRPEFQKMLRFHGDVSSSHYDFILIDVSQVLDELCVARGADRHGEPEVHLLKK